MKHLPLRRLNYHRDYDGVVAAAMVQACASTALDLHPVQYAPDLNWTGRSLPPETGIVDFLFHPDATFWLDHHPTTFPSDAVRQSFHPDPFHVFAPHARSCPGVIVGLPWFEQSDHWNDYVRWADVIDSAAYASPTEANDLGNPHVLLSHIIADIEDPDVLSQVVLEVVRSPASSVVEMPPLGATKTRLLQNDNRIRRQLSSLLLARGRVVVLDQSNLDLAYRRYLAYEYHPESRYGIGLYRSGKATVVSVGENPWNKPGPIHLGELCREFGGGGRRATAGVPMPSAQEARMLAERLVDRLNQALLAEESRVSSERPLETSPVRPSGARASVAPRD